MTTISTNFVRPVDSVTPATAPDSASGQGKLFAGIVKHAGKAVPNARVELRELGWATSRTAAVAAVQADEEGAFSLANPPRGDFSVLGFFADGEMDAGGWPPVSIAPDQEITGFVVPLERRLTLLSPIAGSVTSTSPALNWNAADERDEVPRLGDRRGHDRDAARSDNDGNEHARDQKSQAGFVSVGGQRAERGRRHSCIGRRYVCSW